MSVIYIDVTDLENWSGNYIGIHRVIYGIAQGFYRSGLDNRVAFISYNEQKGCFNTSTFLPSMGASSTNKLIRNTLLSKKRKIKFAKGDKVLLAGRTWDNPDIHQILKAEKNKNNIKIIQVIYDLIICLQPQLQNPIVYESYTRYMREACELSDLLLAISHSTANDLKKFCKQQKILMPMVKVIRLGEEIPHTPKDLSKTNKPNKNIQKDFIICVGTIEIRKNQTLLYYVYKLSKARNISLPQLVIIGRRGWLSDDIQHLIDHDPEINKDILILDDVDDKGLAWAYRNCLFSIYPSMYEGWGLPVAESLNYGKLCLSSSTSSMPEIAGNLIDYFSPYSTEECLTKIQTYLNDKVLAAKSTSISRNYKPTTWDTTFKQIEQFISLLGETT